MSSFSSFVNRVAEGDLGTVGVDTNITFDNRSILNLGLSVFVAGVLVILAYFALVKILK